MTLNDHINKILNDHTSTVYHAGCGPSLVTQLALRVRELEVEVAQLTDGRDLAKSALFLLRGAVQRHQETHYLPVSYCAARPTNAPHDQALYNAAGVHWIKPEAWDHDPSTYRLAGMRAHWERRQTDAITAADPVRVDDTPEQPSGGAI